MEDMDSNLLTRIAYRSTPFTCNTTRRKLTLLQKYLTFCVSRFPLLQEKDSK